MNCKIDERKLLEAQVSFVIDWSYNRVLATEDVGLVVKARSGDRTGKLIHSWYI